MDVREAKAFLAVAEDLHFGRAAARLHMAQPPLSRLIRSLERDLDATLFDRSPRRVALTPAGLALVEPARELVMQSERIAEVIRAVQNGYVGRIRLGFAGASVGSVVSGLVKRVHRQRPGIHVDLHGSQLSHPGLERLRTGSLDAIVGRWDYLPRDVGSTPLATEDLLIALPEGHPLAEHPRLSAEILADEPWVVLPGGSGATLWNRLRMLGIRGKFQPRIVQTAVDSASQLLLVDTGVGIALTFSSVRDSFPTYGVVFRPVDAGLGLVEVRLAWKQEEHNPATLALIELARSIGSHNPEVL